MRTRIKFLILLCLTMGLQLAFAQGNIKEEIKGLSKKKWQLMSEKNVDELAKIFHDQSKFVHMSGTWKKQRELEIIESGSIWYKNAIVHDVAVETFGEDTAILWNRITLEADVRGNDVSNEFTVTEFYKKEAGDWKLLDLTPLGRLRNRRLFSHRMNHPVSSTFDQHPDSETR